MTAIEESPKQVSLRRILPPVVTGQEVVLFIVIAVLWVLLGIFTPAFITPGSIGPLLVQVAPIALVGVGMTFIIITAGIDVSVAAMIMVSAVVTARMMVSLDIPTIVAIAVAIAIGLALGAINGLLIAYGRVHSIIITFGTANVFLWLGLRVFDSSTVNGIPGTLDFLGRGDEGATLGMPHSFAIALVATIAAWWFLRYAKAGRSLYAIGGNQNAARLAGIKVQPRLVWVYAVTGALAGLAACMMIATGTSTLDQSVGSGKELQVIAAVVIGGTSLSGGVGRVTGTLIGALIIGVMNNGLDLMGIQSYYQQVLKGALIVGAVMLDQKRNQGA